MRRPAASNEPALCRCMSQLSYQPDGAALSPFQSLLAPASSRCVACSVSSLLLSNLIPTLFLADSMVSLKW